MTHLTKRFDPEEEVYEKGIEACYKELRLFSPTKESLLNKEISLYGLRPASFEERKALVVYVVHGEDHLRRFYTSIRLYLNILKADRFDETGTNDRVMVLYSGISNTSAKALRLTCEAQGISSLKIECPHEGGFCLSYYRNKSIEVAHAYCIRHRDVKLVALVDCDFVPAQELSSRQPGILPTGFAKFLVWDLDAEKNPLMFRRETSASDIKRTALTNGKFIGPGWFLFRPELLFNKKFGHKLRFCEEYRGLGYEDFAFEQVVLRQHEVFRSAHSSFWAFHLSHPKTPMGDDYAANRKRYIDQLVEITKNNNIRIDPMIMHNEDVNAYCECMKAELFRS